MTRNKWLHRLIWLVAVVPMLLAWGLAYLGDDVDLGNRSHGELAPAGMTVPETLSSRFGGKWGLLVLSQDCQYHCQQQLYRLRQIHIAMGRDIDRIQSIWLSDENESLPDTLELRQVTTLTEPSLIDWFSEHNLQWQDQGIWLVDPNGILVMRFSPELKGKQILSDLHWLLKVSQVG